MKSFTLVDTGIMYRNPKPHLESIHAYFPSVVKISKTELFASTAIGSAFDSVDTRTQFFRSHDAGKTWEKAGILKNETNPPKTSSTTRISITPDGEIILIGGKYNRTHQTKELANPETGGFTESTLFTTRSKDNGHTWSELQTFVPPIEGQPYEVCAAPVYLSSDNWVLPSGLWKAWDGSNSHGIRALLMRSKDQGKTWNDYTTVMYDKAQKTQFWEPKLIKVNENLLLVTCWTHDLEKHTDKQIHFSVSRDNGQTFSDPKSIGLDGQTCTPHMLSDDKIIFCYRRTDKPGFWGAVGRLKDNDEVEIIEQHPIFEGVGNAKDQNNAILGMNNLKFGYPNVIQLDEKTLFVSIWSVEDCVSNIRWFKLEINN